jgi:hypothetical protein
MAQHDYNIANQSGAAFRQDLNNALAAIVSQNSGAVEPSTTYAYQFWADTTAGLLKIRNAANSAWITLRELDGTLAIEAGTVSAPGVAFTGDLNTGLYSPGADQAAISTGGVQAVAWDANGNQTNRAGITATNLNGGQLAGMRNRLINGAMPVSQRDGNSSRNFNQPGTLFYTVDRWYGYYSGDGNTFPSGQRIQGATAGQFYYRFTGAALVTALGFGQRIEQLNSADLAGTTATLSVDLANSLLTTVTWTAYYANTADAFGTLASPTRTQIATGTFTVTSTVARYNTNISIPAAATTGIEIVFTVGAQTSGTWTVGGVQLEPGTVATPFERRSYGQELALCQRYYETGEGWMGGYSAAAGIGIYHGINWKVTKRAVPTLGYGVVGISNVSVYDIRNATVHGANWYSDSAGAGGTAWNGTWTASIEL